MYVEDQDEDVEEEEEFHEVEEEEHKTSQEFGGTSGEHSKKNSPVHRDKLTPVPLGNQEPLEKSGHHACIDTKSTETKEHEHVTANTDVTDDHSVQVGATKEPPQDAVSTETPSQTAEPTEAPEATKTLEAAEAKHKASDVAQTDDATESNEAKATEQVAAPKSGIDWANIMMHSATNGSESSQMNSSSDKVDSCNTVSEPIANKEDTIDSIIQDTRDLKIREDSFQDTSVPAPVDDKKITPVSSDAKTTLVANLDSNQVPEQEINEVTVTSQKDESESVGEDQDKVDEAEKKELDLDEDVKNPQYIPKKGVFYEHDDRSHDADEKKSSPSASKKEDESVEVKDAIANKKSGGEKLTDARRGNRRQRTDADRWNHDLFRNEKQKPKSKSELINAYGYDIRQEIATRGSAENRSQRTSNTSSSINDRAIGGQDSQRSRQHKEARGPRQIPTSASSGSRERKPRRQNTKTNRSDNSQATSNRPEAATAPKTSKIDNTRDLRETLNEKHAARAAESAATRRDRDGSGSNRNARNDSRGRRRTSRDRPNNEDARLPPPNSVMPPITTWSSEDMMIAEAFGKKSPPQVGVEANSASNTSNTKNAHRDRPGDGWEQGPPSKPVCQDRLNRNNEEMRQQQHYNSRNRYQDRGDDNHRPAQFTSRTQYHDRSNQQHEWNRTGNFSHYAKSNDYVVKTQTFENSRLSQATQNRGNNNRDLRDVINERRGNGQQNFLNKLPHNVDHHANQRSHVPGHYHNQYPSAQHYVHPHHQQMVQNQSHMPQQAHQQLTLTQGQLQQPQRSQQQSTHQIQAAANQTHQLQQQNSQAQHSRQPPTTQTGQSVAGHPRQNLSLNSVAEANSGSMRLSTVNNNDPMNSRPIVKTETYTGAGLSGHQQHTQALSQHSQNHGSIHEPLTQASGVTSSSHIVPSHLSTTVSQPQYYQPSNNTREPSSAALASAYHGYMPGGHPVVDPSRYHITSQIPDHGYITPGQTSDVATSSVLHQQGLYTDNSGAGAMSSTAYLSQAGSSLSPTTNIPVTGTGSQPLPPVSYIQHSQYAPPPYSNPYNQPQMNQPPPQSGHTYPYWTYI